jgi:LDH2 family malate/lactate/ureidoglycolate dehydrogenase
VAGHKDYGFALAAALIGGLAQGGDPAPSIGETERDKPPINGVTIIVIDPAAFGDHEAYVTRVSSTLDAVTQVEPAVGALPVLAPGEPEERMHEERTRTGIPISAAIWQGLMDVARHLDVPPPVPHDAARAAAE